MEIVIIVLIITLVNIISGWMDGWMAAARLRRAIARSDRKYCVLGDESCCHEVTVFGELLGDSPFFH